MFWQGLVDYISEPNSSGFERAVKLAEEIAVNGKVALAMLLWVRF
jgi:hypothetical protein